MYDILHYVVRYSVSRCTVYTHIYVSGTSVNALAPESTKLILCSGTFCKFTFAKRGGGSTPTHLYARYTFFTTANLRGDPSHPTHPRNTPDFFLLIPDGRPNGAPTLNGIVGRLLFLFEQCESAAPLDVVVVQLTLFKV